MCCVEAADTKSTSAKLAAKMKADSAEEQTKTVPKTPPEKQKVVSTKSLYQLCLKYNSVFAKMLKLMMHTKLRFFQLVMGFSRSRPIMGPSFSHMGFELKSEKPEKVQSW